MTENKKVFSAEYVLDKLEKTEGGYWAFKHGDDVFRQYQYLEMKYGDDDNALGDLLEKNLKWEDLDKEWNWEDFDFAVTENTKLLLENIYKNN